jgi:OHS family lactose permease-like MFS transporter
MYDKVGFQGAYLVLGLVALSFTVLSVFTLSGMGPLDAIRSFGRPKEKLA